MTAKISAQRVGRRNVLRQQFDREHAERRRAHEAKGPQRQLDLRCAERSLAIGVGGARRLERLAQPGSGLAPEQDVAAIGAVDLLGLGIEQDPDRAVRRQRLQRLAVQHRQGIGGADHDALRVAQHGAGKRWCRMLHAGYAQRRPEATLGGRPHIEVADAQLVGEEAEQLGRIVIQAGRQRQRPVQCRVGGDHWLHRIQPGTIVRLALDDDAHPFGIDRQWRIRRLGHRLAA